MDSSPSPIAGLLGFWMLLRLVGMLGALGGGIYALYCFSRAASGLERMASALEEWVALQVRSETAPQSGTVSGGGNSLPPENPAVSRTQNGL